MNFTKIFKQNLLKIGKIIIEKLKKLSKNPLFNSLFNLAMLVIAILALFVAKKTLENADIQFRQNSDTSDSLFNVQLEYSKNLNDSLIYQISKLQEITNKQLEITDQQLRVSIETYQEQLYSGRPKILLGATQIKDTNYIFNDLFAPQIETPYENIGKRYACDLIIRTFVVFPDYSGVRHGHKSKDPFMEPEANLIYKFKPKIPIKYKENFYYCFEVFYIDTTLNQKFNYAYYFHYFKDRESFNFYFCDDIDIKQKVKIRINDDLHLRKERLFDELP